MSERNPACAMMTAQCPPGNDCRLQAVKCWIETPDDGGAIASVYRYQCLSCQKSWTVAFPQDNPVFDRNGAIIAAPVPVVVPE